MKMRYISLFAGVLLVACTQDPTSQPVVGESADITRAEKILLNPQGASQGELAVKIAEESLRMLELEVTRSGETRTGLAGVDAALQKIGALRFERLLHDEPFEQELREAGLHRWYKVSFDREADLERAAHELAGCGEILAVEFMHAPKRPVTRLKEAEYTRAESSEESEALANDPEVGRQWNFENTGALAGSVEGADINLRKAWELCTGSEEIVVAVIDEPVMTTHEDLKANMWVNDIDASADLTHGANFCTNKKNPIAIDWNYKNEADETPTHGTHVAGIVAAVNGNNTGICGIAGGRDGSGGVKIMSCQIFYKENEINEAASNAMIWAANRGALIAQCSFGYDPSFSESSWTNYCTYEMEAIDYFIARKRTNAPIDGGLVIFAAGNDGNSYYLGKQVKDTPLVPGCYPSTIAVAATAPDYTPAGYSCYGDWVDISAPGGDSDNFDTSGMIYSTIIGRNANYAYMEGTSMACPHVSGVAALGLSYAHKLGKTFTTDEFRSLLLASTRAIDPYFSGAKSTLGYNYSSAQWQDVVINLNNYKNKMGGGQIDAYLMLLNVAGLPIMSVGVETSTTLDLSPLVGGVASTSGFAFELFDTEEAEQELGFSYEKEGQTGLKVRCSQCGTATLGVRYTVGETTVEQHFALYVRPAQAANGAWL